jgi:hypothetical protein
MAELAVRLGVRKVDALGIRLIRGVIGLNFAGRKQILTRTAHLHPWLVHGKLRVSIACLVRLRTDIMAYPGA